MGGGLFAGLQVALSGLQAQEAVMSVASHNIANGSNANYALQQVDLAPNPPYSPPTLDQPSVPGQFGQGVQVAAVTRQVSHFLQMQQWTNDGQVGAATQQANTLSQAQALLNEPSSSGLNQAMDQFWQAWDALSSNPQSVAARSQVVNQGQALAGTFNTLSQGLGNLQQSLDATVVGAVGQINGLAQQIASYNKQIGAASAAGQQPNDLKDQRDALIGKLAQLVPVQVSWASDGEATVGVGGIDVVAGTQVEQLQTAVNPNTGLHGVNWSFSGQPAAISGGELGALLTLRDQTLPGYLNQLNTLAGAIGQAVNQQQAAGSDANGNPVATYDGGAYAGFFTGAAAAPSLSQAAGTSSLAAASYNVAYAYTNTSGTTEVAPSSSIFLSHAGNTISFQVPLPSSANGVNVYVGTGASPRELGRISASGAVSYSGGATSGLSATVSTGTTGGTVLTITLSAPGAGSAQPPAQTAANIAVNPSLLSAPQEVAAAGSPSGGPGDGSNALAIANLQNQQVVAAGTPGAATAGDAYAALVGQIGTDVATAQATQSQQQSLQQSISTQQQSISGVSLNQEMVQMVQAQNVFSAAARVTSAIDSMLGTLVNMTQ